MLAFQIEAVECEGSRPDAFAVSSLSVAGEAGVNHRVLHVMAMETEVPRCWTLAVADLWQSREDVVGYAVEALTALPQPRRTLVTTASCHNTEHRVIADIVNSLKVQRPDHSAIASVDWLGNHRTTLGLRLGRAVTSLNRSLEALAREMPLSVAELERRALVRQGFCRVAQVPSDWVVAQRNAEADSLVREATRLPFSDLRPAGT